MTSISKDEEQILNRRFPKIIADEYSVAINIATRLLGDDVQKYLTQYNEWRMKFIAANGLTISGLTVGVNSHNIDNKKNVALPNMYDPPINNDAQFAIDKLATALDRMEAFRADPSLYLAKSVVSKAVEISDGEGLKELVGDKFLEEIAKRALSKNSRNAGLARGKADIRTQALKDIENIDYPANKHLFHLRGRRDKFANDMLVKYKNEGLVSKERILQLVDKLNTANGITQKKPK